MRSGGEGVEVEVEVGNRWMGTETGMRDMACVGEGGKCAWGNPAGLRNK